MTITGIGLAMGNWVSLLSAAGCAISAYGWRIRIEERALRARFGAKFEQNRAQTWAVIPFIW
jgi:protein-S-isoprenylcysteine O-methyltransferase Ste14